MEPTPNESLLTAYLDGELAPQDRQRLEQRLADEPELRQQLTLLEDTWYCLDVLEQECADAEKIETTMITAAISVSAVPFPLLKINRWGKWGMTALAGLTLFALTFQLGKRIPNEHVSSEIVGKDDIQRLAETLEKLPPWEKDNLLDEKPHVIINELKQ